MIGLIQRVKAASVEVDQQQVASINQGILLLLGVEREDNESLADKLLAKVSRYRIFEDEAGKMNYSLLDIQGDLLVVSQFTLAAQTRKGLRPGFDKAASPDKAKALYQYFIQQAENTLDNVQSGIFAADMQVSLINDGPVTFWLQV